MNLLKTTKTEIDNASSATHLDRGKPRILYLVTRAERGGAQTHVLDLACSMQPDFEVSVATGEEGFLTEACRERAIPVYVLPHLQREVRPMADALAFGEIWQLIRKLRPDLLHLHTFKAGFLARLAGRILRIPSVYTIHAWLYGTAAVSRFSSLLSGPCERLAARWCERIITVSRAGARILRGHRIGSFSKLVTIHNGLPDCSERARISPTKTPVITMVARFIEGKDHDLLLRAFAGIPKGPRLRLIGDGPTRASVESLARELGIQEQVDFLGNRDDVASLLATSDVFVLASRSEMLPISILEAMRAGLPVIASDVGGVGEAIAHNENGFLVPSGSVNALAQALADLTNDYALRLRMGQAGRQRFADQFLSSSMQERTRAVYWEVLQSLGRARRKRNAAAAPASMAPPATWQTA
jgi:glycosyltransferase involved in cell wall biosynthesis